MSKDVLKEKVRNNAVVKSFIDLVSNRKDCHNLRLAGGAIVDILEGRTPKDYDFVGGSDLIISYFKDNGYKFVSDTCTATTYRKDRIIVQFLKTDTYDFEFTISQASYNVKEDDFDIDLLAFNDKTLIPCNWYNKAKLFDGLRRVPHWYRKGYTIKDATYLSMLNATKPKHLDVVPFMS